MIYISYLSEKRNYNYNLFCNCNNTININSNNTSKEQLPETQIIPQYIYQEPSNLDTAPKINSSEDFWFKCSRMEYRRDCTISYELYQTHENPGEYCREDIMLDLLVYVTRELDKHKIVHWIGFGTLLGLIRKDHIIPW